MIEKILGWPFIPITALTIHLAHKVVCIHLTTTPAVTLFDGNNIYLRKQFKQFDFSADRIVIISDKISRFWSWLCDDYWAFISGNYHLKRLGHVLPKNIRQFGIFLNLRRCISQDYEEWFVCSLWIRNWIYILYM